MTFFSRFSCNKVSLLAYFLLLMQFSFAQSDFSAVDSKIAQYQKQLGNDIVVLVSKDNKVIYQKAIGKEFTPVTPVDIDASSQWLTAALVMTFVQEGKLNLDDPVSKYLPIFAKYMKSYVTIRQCLNHTTGIAGEKALIRRVKSFTNLEEEVNEIASKKEIEAQPGAAFVYNNQNLNIAGRVLEVISRKSFERLMTDRILRPLGMKNTAFNNEKAVNPSLGAVSTATDYLHFLQMLLNKGTYAGKQILTEASVQEMLSPSINASVIKYSPKLTEGFLYARGCWIQASDSDEKPATFCSPSLTGTWPVIDLQNNYACIILAKRANMDIKKEVYQEIKTAIDNAIAAK